MLSAALKYAGIGWHVFPLRESGDIKAPHPMLGEKEGHRKATTDAAQIRAWWSAHPNAGIGVWLQASGLIAVDIDPKNGGDKSLREFEAKHGALASEIVAATGSGGEHRIFAAPEGVKPPGHIGHSKSGIDLKYNGYIVVSPSPHPYPHAQLQPGQKPTRRYKWKEGKAPFDNMDWLSPIPEWTLVRTIAGRTEITRATDPDDIFREDSQKCGLTLDQMQAKLDLYQNDADADVPYDDWLNVLAGIYHETDGSEEGKTLAYEWSAQSAKHTDEKFEKSWASLDVEGKGIAPVTFRFVLRKAKDAADKIAKELFADLKQTIETAGSLDEIKEAARSIKTAEIDSIDRGYLAKLIQEHAKRVANFTIDAATARSMVRYEPPDLGVLPPWLEGWVYVARDDVFYHPDTNRELGVKAFDRQHAVYMMSVKDAAEGRAFPETAPSDAALNRHKIPKVHSKVYWPGEPQFFGVNGADYINTYTDHLVPEVPSELTPADRENIETMVGHFRHMIPDDRERAIVMSWFAYRVQSVSHPNWAVVIQGPEADGKTWFAEMMAAVLGGPNVKIIDPDLLRHPFTDWAEGSMLTVIEEIRLHGAARFEILDKLKPFITNDTIAIHPKGKKAYQVHNTAAYLAFTNYRDAMPLDGSDTRYFLIASPRQRKEQVEAFKRENPDYFTRLYLAHVESAGALRKFWLEYPLHPEFLPRGRAPYSREKEIVVELGKSDVQQAIEDILAEGSNLLITERLLETAALSDELMQRGLAIPSTKGLQYLLSHKLGFESIGRVKVAGTANRYWTRRLDAFSRVESERNRQIRDWIETVNL
jgi:sugar-specific transcriptional regulator TrmB